MSDIEVIERSGELPDMTDRERLAFRLVQCASALEPADLERAIGIAETMASGGLGAITPEEFLPTPEARTWLDSCARRAGVNGFARVFAIGQQLAAGAESREPDQILREVLGELGAALAAYGRRRDAPQHGPDAA